MVVRVQCANPACNKPYNVDESQLGRTAVCKHCGRKFLLSTSGDDTTRAEKQSSISTGRSATLPSGDPAQIGRFKVRCRLGVGGFGAVYRAYDPVLDREVALKVPHPGRFEDEKDRTRVLREAKATARLHHPHIVPVYDAGGDAQSFYIASAFIEGQTLEQKATQQTLPVHETASIVMKLAEALDHAHSLGIVHRDVKPSNIMLDKQGEPMLMDFGLARIAESESQLTQDGTVLGTPAYMSPEQAKGRQEQVGPATDQYSLGAVLYRLLCGQPPFSGGTHAIMFHVLHRDPPQPRSINPRIPNDLQVICLKAMAKEPEHRYAGCQELADDLRRWLQGHPIRARRVGPIERLYRWSRRNPVVAGLVATAALLLLIIAVVAKVGSIRTSRALVQTEAERERADEEKNRAEQNLYDAQIMLAQKSWSSGKVGEAQRLLDSCPNSFRNWEWGYLKLLWHENPDARKMRVNQAAVRLGIHPKPTHDDNQDTAQPAVSSSPDKTGKLGDAITAPETLTLNRHTGRVRSVAFSPDGKRIVSGDDENTVKVSDAITGKEISTFPDVSQAVFSADGKRLVAVDREGSLKVLDANTGRVLLTLRPTSGHVWSAAFSPDGKMIVGGGEVETVEGSYTTMERVRGKGGLERVEHNVLRGDGIVHVWDATTRQEVLTLRGTSGPIQSVAFSADGKWVAAGSGPNRLEGGALPGNIKQATLGTVQIWDAIDGREVLALRGHGGGVYSIAFSPDGKRIISGSDDQTIKIWDTMSGKDILTLCGHSKPVYGVAFSPNGTRIVSASDDETLKMWNTANGHEYLTLRGHSARIRAVSFSPDGKRIASGSDDRTVKIWDGDASKEPITFWGHAQGVKCVAFSPRSERIVSGAEDSTVKVWDGKTGQEYLTLGGHAGPIWAVAFSPDEQLVGSGGEDKTVKIWDATTGKETRTIDVKCRISGLAFSADGARIIGGTFDGMVKVWSVATGSEILVLNAGYHVFSLTISPDGKLIAAGALRATLWDATTGRESQRLAGPWAPVYSVAFSPDGKRIVGGCHDQTVRVWEIATGQELLTIPVENSDIRSVAFSPDGKLIAGTGNVALLDPTAKVWDARTGKEVVTLRGHSAPVRSLAFSPDGKWIATGSEDGTVKVWPVADSRRTTGDAAGIFR